MFIFILTVCYTINSNDDKDIVKESLGDSYQVIKQAALDVLENVANKQVRVCIYITQSQPALHNTEVNQPYM